MTSNPLVSTLKAHARFSLLITLCATLCPSAPAQNASRPDRGISPIGSYSVSDIENINLTNGNVNLSIPLANLPPISGGKLSWALRAIYNSKQWDRVGLETPSIWGANYVQNILQLGRVKN